MSERKMVTYREIDRLSPIAGADAIELAHIGGWQVVVKKGEFEVGDGLPTSRSIHGFPMRLPRSFQKARPPASITVLQAHG